MIFLADFTSNCKCAMVTIMIYFLLETMIMSAVMGQTNFLPMHSHSNLFKKKKAQRIRETICQMYI